MRYQLHLNLQQRATLRAAISFWENKEVKDKVTELFRSCYELEIFEAREKWDQLKKAVINEWNRDLLPQKVDIELINIVKMIGDTIFNWYYYIKDQYEARHQAINCIDKIHWTPYGTVDAVKTFKTYWLNNPDLGSIEKYNFACNHMIEDHINDLWNKIPRSMQSHHYTDTLKSFDGHLLAYWKHHRDGDLPNLRTYLRIAINVLNRQYMREFSFIYEFNRSTEENMLRLSAYQGYFSAVNYFWEKLTEEEQNESVVKCARIALLSCYHYYHEHKYIEHYKINEYIEICIFLMNQMTDDHKKALFDEELNPLAVRLNGYTAADARDEILRMLLTGWPWQELFIPVLEDMIRLLDDDSSMDCKFLDIITEKMSDDYLAGYSTEMSNYRSLLREAWFIIPASIKQDLVEIDEKHYFISDLIDIWDLNSLKLILNDPEIAAIRNQYINFGTSMYNKLIKSNEIEKIDQFFREIFKTEEEIKDFKKSIDLLYTFMLNHDYHSADKFLDWVCSTPEEKESKKKMEFETIFDVLIGEHDFKVLDKFLNWTFKTEEEKKIHKNRLKNDVHTVYWIFDIWSGCNRDINKAKDECSQFLHWLLESEEEIAILKKELFSAERNQINLYVLGQLKRKGVMKDLFSWCMLPDEEVQRIEQALTQQNRQL